MAATTQRKFDGWAIALWLIQALLAVMFLYAGIMKATSTPEALAEMGWHWATTLPVWFILFVGVAEILGAVGIILPAATRILPWLTPLAAVGMVVVQVAAIILHGVRGETTGTIILNLILLVAALFVIFGRTKIRPITAR